MSIASVPILHSSAAPRRRPRYPYVPVGYTVGLVACVAIPVGVTAMFATHVTWVAPIGWILLPLMAIVNYGVCGVIALGAFEHVRASWSPDNWLAQLVDEGVYLNVRSFLNWRYPRHLRTVAFVPYQAIESVHSLHETFVLPLRHSRTVRYYSFTVLTLKPGISTSELDAAVRAELMRVPNKGFFESFKGWDDVPVFVGRPGEIWIAYRTGRVRRALARRVPSKRSESRRVAGDVLAEVGDEWSVRRLGLDALYRGDRVGAARALEVALGLKPTVADARLKDILEAGS